MSSSDTFFWSSIDLSDIVGLSVRSGLGLDSLLLSDLDLSDPESFSVHSRLIDLDLDNDLDNDLDLDLVLLLDLCSG